MTLVIPDVGYQICGCTRLSRFQGGILPYDLSALTDPRKVTKI